MRIREMLAIGLVGVGCCLSAAADENACSSSSSLGVAQCSAEKLKQLEEQLDSSYTAALEKLPDTSRWDVRKTKGQLIKAQAAWKSYRDENCSYMGGLQGGDNIMVTQFSDDCALDETRKRIEFFRDLPKGS
ncbi:lysozyme inhibitor LprI family protein [Pseudomonas gingeri]|uniref:DUF1311 domain-containing protein n=1 Tax=Pseudomonas gingeri TaxID=117681 RepID=A0A7Y7YIU7_9PSED|nr:lysozyme inhibitor LprI family protein [Pseudomonas gingeri]NWB28424.1 DUF1311 domain-containing protein [Pseudomonas gingeri]NWC37328.1 DUF1311 domain-containing protein [Pseudomonas gingeri]